MDVTGRPYGDASRWVCHGCGARSEFPDTDILAFTRMKANVHAGECRAAYHRLA